MNASVRILALGAAAPSLRLETRLIAEAWSRGGGRGQVAVCASDEDVLTLAAEAGQHALTAAGLDPSAVSGLWWGTARPPFAEGPSHAILAATLGLGPQTGGALCSGSTHAGMDALLGAADAIAAGTASMALVIVSDALLPSIGTGFESRAGAGAAAVVLAATGGVASLGPRFTTTAPLIDRYRGSDELVTREVYDGRLFREEIFLPIVGGVVDRVVADSVDRDGVDAWSLPDPDGRLAATIAKRLGATNLSSAAVFGAIGDTGAAAALLGAINALSTVEARGTVATVGFGGGRCTAVIINAEGPIPGAASLASLLSAGRQVSYTGALRARGQLVAGGETIPMGVPPESAMFVRGAHEMLELLGARCVECGTVNTPPSIHPTCISCGHSKFEEVGLARRGVIHTYVVNQTMPAPFVAPLPIAVIDLDDGARLMLQVTDDPSGVAIGATVELVLRRYANERGVPVYGFKARVIGS